MTLMGPTASGKTALAMALHDKYPIDIISVDSALVYRGMDIGTAKLTAEELLAYPHKLVDILDPVESYSAMAFRNDAIAEIESSLARGRIPLLVGGTMLYFKALIEGLSPLPAADYTVRKKIEEEAIQIGWQALHKRLEKIDPLSAKRIHPNDAQRLLRAFEVYLIAGKSLTELTQMASAKLPYKVSQFAIAPAVRSVLHDRIAKRFYHMLKQGFENEVAKLMDRGDLHADLPAIRCVGYRQMWDYLSGNSHYDEMVFKAIVATKQLAKRQMTWLRSWPEITWLNSDAMTDAFKTVSMRLDQWGK